MIEELKEWENIIKQLQIKETEYYQLKEALFDKEQKIIEETDFKELYGKNNSDIRKQHLKKELGEDYTSLKSLELCIEHDKRRISYLRERIKCERLIHRSLL